MKTIVLHEKDNTPGFVLGRGCLGETGKQGNSNSGCCHSLEHFSSMDLYLIHAEKIVLPGNLARRIYSLIRLLSQIRRTSQANDSNRDNVEMGGMLFGDRSQRTANSPFPEEIQLFHSSHRKP